MQCTSIVSTEEQQKIYETESILPQYDVVMKDMPLHIVEEDGSIHYDFEYCIKYRHPLLPEWILARGYWNDEGVWMPTGIFDK